MGIRRFATVLARLPAACVAEAGAAARSPELARRVPRNSPCAAPPPACTAAARARASRCPSRSCETAKSRRQCRRAARATTVVPSGGAPGDSMWRARCGTRAPERAVMRPSAPTAGPSKTGVSNRRALREAEGWRVAESGQPGDACGVLRMWRRRLLRGGARSCTPARRRPHVLRPKAMVGRRSEFSPAEVVAYNHSFLRRTELSLSSTPQINARSINQRSNQRAHGIRYRSRAGAPAEVRRPNTGRKRRPHGSFEARCGGGMAKVLEHQATCQHSRHGVRDSFTGEGRRRSMDRLEQRLAAPGVQVCAGGEAEPAHQPRAQVGKDVTIEVIGHDDFEALRFAYQLQRQRIDIPMLGGDLWVLARYRLEPVLPDAMGGNRVRLVAHRHALLAMGLCPLEGRANDALDSLSRVDFLRDVLIAC